MRRGQFLPRVFGVILLLVGLGALVALYSDTSDWAAPRGRHAAWVGGRATLILRFVAGTCTFGSLAVLGRSFRRGRQSGMGAQPED
jgi:hypothetical protein